MKIQTSGLDRLDVYQINPTEISASTQLTVTNEKNEIIFESSAGEMNPLSARCHSIPKAKLSGSEHVSVHILGLTGQNSKPLLFCHFDSGLFSGSHS
jgi:hypothetical protein